MHTKYVIPPPPSGTPPTLGGECHPDAWTMRCAKKYIITYISDACHEVCLEQS